ncbi:MAG: CBS domain-containing protein [Deltaproteobacteria bacterium]|nr:CBS domain-containing protein [Deltaproteobacteria bacterium]
MRLGSTSREKDMGREMDMGWSNNEMSEKRIKDLMFDPDAFTHISPKAKVAEAVKVLSEKWHSQLPAFVLVVDESENKEEILGMLSPDNVLGHMESSAELVDELPIFWQGQFHEECEVILDSPIVDIMSSVTRVIHESGTLTEAVHLMNLQGINWLPVVADEEVVGILLKEALLKEVFAVAKEEKGV